MFKNLRFALAPALIVSLLAPSFAAAAIVNPNILFGLFKKPFGGKITKIQACASPPGLILHIGPPIGGQYFLGQSTIIHSYGVITPGVWTLGIAEPSAKTCVGAQGGGGGFVLNGLAETGLIEGAEFLQIPTFIDLPIFGPVSLISIGLNILSALGISFFKKNPPTYGPAYPIIRIGTGPVPVPTFT